MGQDKKTEKKDLKAEELEKRAAPFTVSYTDSGGTTGEGSIDGTDTTGGDSTTVSGSQTGHGKGLMKK